MPAPSLSPALCQQWNLIRAPSFRSTANPSSKLIVCKDFAVTANAGRESNIHEGHHLFGVAKAAGCAARDYLFDPSQLFRRKSYLHSRGVLLQIGAPFRAGNRDDVVSLGEDPSERQL